jgi:hypothetical protein
MPIVLIDYAHLYYREIAGSAVPPVIKGKFVQIRDETTLYLIFSPTEFTKYHANIVERFCFEKNIMGSYDSERKRYTISDKAWTIIGGGKFEIDRERKAIKLYDDSMAYGKFDKTGLKDAMLSLCEFSGFTLQME